MSYRVQCTVSEEQYEKLQSQSVQEGYPTVGEMVKAKILREDPTYSDLYKEMAMKITQIDPKQIINSTLGEGEFYLSDLINNPPALLGRFLYQRVADGTIDNVISLGRNGKYPNKYKKIGK